MSDLGVDMSDSGVDMNPAILPEEQFLLLTINELTTSAAQERYCGIIADVWWGEDLGDQNCWYFLVSVGAETIIYPDTRDQIFDFCLTGVAGVVPDSTPDCDWETVQISREFHETARDLWCTEFDFPPFTNWNQGPHPDGDPSTQCPFERLP
ncbi:MAG: hypothetical protein AAGH15_01310 [Myxococcota bacterium]